MYCKSASAVKNMYIVEKYLHCQVSFRKNIFNIKTFFNVSQPVVFVYYIRI